MSLERFLQRFCKTAVFAIGGEARPLFGHVERG